MQGIVILFSVVVLVGVASIARSAIWGDQEKPEPPKEDAERDGR